MLEVYGNIWDLANDDYDALVITTNGFVKSNGDAVLGRGIAKEATERYFGIAKTLGIFLRERGNYPHILVHSRPSIVSMPVKPQWGPNGEMGWKAKAEIPLIRDSAEVLVNIADTEGWDRIIMPRPGCGNGKLTWEEVKPIIEPILDDRFTVVTWNP